VGGTGLLHPSLSLVKTNGNVGRMGLKPGERRNTKAFMGFSPISHTLPSVSTDVRGIREEMCRVSLATKGTLREYGFSIRRIIIYPILARMGGKTHIYLYGKRSKIQHLYCKEKEVEFCSRLFLIQSYFLVIIFCYKIKSMKKS
jgi:hypothetical protein